MTETESIPVSDLIDRETAAKLAGVHVRTIWRWAKEGRISMTRNPLNGRPYFRRSELLALRASPGAGSTE